MVTIPAETGDTDRLFPKSIVTAVPTVEPLFFTTTPEPEATIPVSADPSSAGSAPLKLDEGTVPLKLVAVITPVILTPPVPVINLLNKSRLPPSCGEVSSTKLSIPVSDPAA